jgi:hypothetical protein
MQKRRGEEVIYIIPLDFAGDGRIVLGRDARTCHYAIGLEAFARFDGFDSWSDMAAFWRETHGVDKFDGWHIRWLPLPPLAPICSIG